MNKPKYDDELDVLGKAYETMYEHAAANLHKLKNLGSSELHQIINDAKDKVSELNELTEENSLKLSEWLKRDFEDAVSYLAETGHEIKDWLGFETSLLESKVLNQFLEVADKTSLELLQFKENTKHPEYHTGEMTGPGTLTCNECGEKLHFYKISKIPPCPKCHASVFHRSTSEL